jgi:hypothetical protein
MHFVTLHQGVLVSDYPHLTAEPMVGMERKNRVFLRELGVLDFVGDNKFMGKHQL